MKNYFLSATLTLLLAVCAPSLAHAETEDGAMVNAALVGKLIAWVERETGASVPVLPTVISSHSRMWKAVGSRATAGHPEAVFAGGTILLDSDNWDAKDPRQVSLLVHEMVHYAQSFMHKNWACNDAKEQQAYRLQNKWLAQNGQPAFASASWIERLSSCGSDSDSVDLAQRQ